MTKFLLVAVIAMVAVACGATASGSSPTPTPREGIGFDVTATNNDHQVTMRAGQKLEVVLHAPNGMNNWTHPVSGDTSILSPIVDPAATAAIGVTLAAFEARRPGEVVVTSNASPHCATGAACPMYLAVYSLKVTVTQ